MAYAYVWWLLIYLKLKGKQHNSSLYWFIVNYYLRCWQSSGRANTRRNGTKPKTTIRPNLTSVRPLQGPCHRRQAAGASGRDHGPCARRRGHTPAARAMRQPQGPCASRRGHAPAAGAMRTPQGPCHRRQGPCHRQQGPCHRQQGPCHRRQGPCHRRQGPCHRRQAAGGRRQAAGGRTMPQVATAVYCPSNFTHVFSLVFFWQYRLGNTTWWSYLWQSHWFSFFDNCIEYRTMMPLLLVQPQGVDTTRTHKLLCAVAT